MTDEERAELRTRFDALLQRWQRYAECSAYLYDNSDDPEWDALTAKLTRMGERWGVDRDALIEFAAAPAADFVDFWGEVVG